jgi:hypothetical protein
VGRSVRPTGASIDTEGLNDPEKVDLMTDAVASVAGSEVASGR